METALIEGIRTIVVIHSLVFRDREQRRTKWKIICTMRWKLLFMG